jgi:hypothetical protein
VNSLRDLLARPLREQHPLVRAAFVLVPVLGAWAIVTGGLHDGRQSDGGSPPPNVPAAPVIAGAQTGAPPQSRPAAAPPGVRRAATSFVESYLPVLYGTARPSSLRSATAEVRHGLTSSARSERSARHPIPRVVALELVSQTAHSALASATVDDGVGPRYRLIFTVERRRKRWVVTNLASD